jgi:serine/threonine protein kinase/cytochrome c-type biogenesis protein CcmH/NrfG
MSASFEKIAAIFQEALEMCSSERDVFLEGACAGDAGLLAEVRSLLRRQGQKTGAFEEAVQPVAKELLGAMPCGPEFPPGAMLGPYRLERRLGEGGMGAVYLGLDTRLGRSVAVKVIGGAIARTAQARARFLREAQSAAALCHPNIAAIYDVGESPESPWLVMEYVDGASLRSLLTGPMTERACLQYAQQIASALAHAHERRIIHRDIKPENILVTADDQVKIIDFGLARALEEEAGASGNITQPNAFVGTIAYAAPELIAGGAASPRSDVYSAGVVLYELACGGHPFANLKGHALYSAITAGIFPACRTRTTQVRAAVASVIDRAMAREPATRYKHGGEFASALQNLDAAQEERALDTGVSILAVVDFENIGSSREFDWLGTAIAESLSADLAKVPSVRMASRSRVVQSRQRTGDPAQDAAAAIEMGRELGARWIVTGGYQKSGERVRVTVTVIDTRSGDALTGEKIDGALGDLFDVQDRAAAAVMRALTLSFGTSEEQKILTPETRDMAAYEHYVRGRRQMYEMQGKSLAAAIRHFEEAIRLDPDYALAYSALGTSHALQFIRTSNPEDTRRATEYLERAIELDPELGEPYPWLANIRLRKNDLAGCLAAGRKGVELQPDLAHAHYFYGGTFYMVPEIQEDGLRKAIDHLVEATRLEPRLHAPWLVLGAALMFAGSHTDAIRVLNEAVRREVEADLLYPFVGARTLLAIAHTRAGSWEAAREWHLESLKSLRNTDHVYTSYFETLSACGLGEIELRRRNEGDAFTYFRRARRIIGESRRALGSARLLIRIDAGLAAAYAVTGDMGRARELAYDARARLEGQSGQVATAAFECSSAQLWLTLACAEIRLGNREGGAGCLARAREYGWLDGAWLRADPELHPLRDHPIFLAFVEEAEAMPAPVLSLQRPGSTSGMA